MRIFPPELEIGPQDGFDPDKDIFKRVQIGRGLTNIVGAVAEPLVIALDGQWGSGKTTFLRMWAGELRKSGFPVIYFDAFAEDYIEDAFAALAGEIIALVKDAKKASTSTARRFGKKAVDVGKVVLRGGLRVGVKAATMGALELADLKEIGGDLANETSTLFDKYVGSMLQTRHEEKSTISAFRDALSELPALLSGEQEGALPDAKPLVFIIDELDRCRPLFALEVLERIKHFFAVPRVHFALGANLAQLQNSVRVAYGPGIDAHTYLQKFIHLTVTLDCAPDHPSERDQSVYIRYLLSKLEFRAEDARTVELCTELIRRIAGEQDLSLRSIERIFSVLAITLAVTGRNSVRLPPVLAGLCVLKVTHPDLFRQAKRGALAFSDIKKIFWNIENETDADKRELEWERDWWRYCLDPDFSREKIAELGRHLGRFTGARRHEVVPFTANMEIDLLVQRGPAS